MSDIQFNSIPVDFAVPGQYGEFNNAAATAGTLVGVPQKILMVGQMLAAGSGVAGRVYQVFGADQVGDLAGRGSMLHQMARKTFAADEFDPQYILLLADAGGATKSTRTVSITGTATEDGEVALYVGDQRYGVPVATGDLATAVATAIVAQLAADDDRYMDGAVDGTHAYTVDLTARNAGIEAGRIPVSLDRYSDEVIPAGLTIAISDLVPGTIDPVLTTALATIAEDWYPTFVVPYTGTANLVVLKAELQDRFGPIRSIDGYGYVGTGTDKASQLTMASAQNSPWLSIIDCGDVLTPPYVIAASVAATSCSEPHPGRPRQKMPLVGVLATAPGARRSISDRNTLIKGGISTLKIDTDGTVRIERLTTTYRTNAYNVTDKSYFDTESMFLLMNIRYSYRAWFAQKYPRHMLGDDGSVGDFVMTPSLALQEGVAIGRQWVDASWMEGGAAFDLYVSKLRAVRQSDDPNRLNMVIPPDIINQLRVLAASFQFVR